MEKIIRIQRAEIKNLQNVQKGSIDFSKHKACNANITGIYGQNGSGKTSFIRSVAMLRHLLSGGSLKAEYTGRMTAGQSETTLDFEFLLRNGGFTKLFYKVYLEKTSAPLELADEKETLVVSRESLSCSTLQADCWSPIEKILEYKRNSPTVILPKTREKEFTVGKKNVLNEFQVAKGLASKLGTSFIFLKDTIDVLNKHCKNSRFTGLITSLREYAMRNLFIIENRDSGLINLNAALPFSFKISDSSSFTMGTLIVALNKPSTIPKMHFEIINRLISDMNRVLEQIIPGLTIKLKELGNQLIENGGMGISVDLVSVRQDTEIPLRYESDGIKKIISVLHMLIEAYNNPSMTLVIDELDSGIFEYMLGELLQSFEQGGEGQLIYTSHNLRPMELLDKNSVVVSTANPKNRYIRLRNIKTNNNTKNVFLRDIVLDGQSETIYEPTNIFEIKHAFRSLRRDTHAS